MSEVIALIRNVVSDFRPTVLYDYGLQVAIKSYIDEYKSRYGIQVHLDQPEAILPRLEPGIAMTVLRIMQEALTNVIRHAQANQVYVSIRLVDDAIRLTVQDNGIGIADGQRAGRPDSHGLRIMYERAEAFGGTVNIGLAPDKGTRVVATIPVQSTITIIKKQPISD
jgi:signal transduction histidine kinase